MQITSVGSKAKTTILAAAIALLGLGAMQAQGQSVTYNFADGNPDGWANAGFSSTPVATVTNISGVNYIFIPLGSFQAANVASGYTSNSPAFTPAMIAAAANPAGYTISYDYYVNTATFSGATFLQLGTFVNTGSGYYKQDYGAPNEVQLSGADIATGGIFQGHISVNMAAINYTNIPPADTFFRLGFIVNGNGTGVAASFSNISVSPVPEPASMALFSIGMVAGVAFLRRRKA